jgi:hypothetical protein
MAVAAVATNFKNARGTSVVSVVYMVCWSHFLASLFRFCHSLGKKDRQTGGM